MLDSRSLLCWVEGEFLAPVTRMFPRGQSAVTHRDASSGRSVFPAPSAQRVSGAPDARRLPVRSLERPAERLLRVVPDPPCDRADAEVGRREQVLGEVHAPLGEVADGRTAEDLAEARVEHRT